MTALTSSLWSVSCADNRKRLATRRSEWGALASGSTAKRTLHRRSFVLPAGGVVPSCRWIRGRESRSGDLRLRGGCWLAPNGGHVETLSGPSDIDWTLLIGEAVRSLASESGDTSPPVRGWAKEHNGADTPRGSKSSQPDHVSRNSSVAREGSRTSLERTVGPSLGHPWLLPKVDGGHLRRSGPATKGDIQRSAELMVRNHHPVG